MCVTIPDGSTPWVRRIPETYIVVHLFLRSINKLILKMSLDLLDNKTALKSGSRDSSKGMCRGKVNKGMLRLMKCKSPSRCWTLRTLLFGKLYDEDQVLHLRGQNVLMVTSLCCHLRCIKPLIWILNLDMCVTGASFSFLPLPLRGNKQEVH